MKQKLLSLLALVMFTMTASAVDTPTYTLTKGTSEHGTITFKVNNVEAAFANEGDVVFVTVEPETGYVVGTVTGYWDAAIAASRSIDMLDEFVLTPVSDEENTWKFTMMRANATVSVSCKKPLQDSWIQPIADQTYNGSKQKPTLTVKDGDKTLVLNEDYTVKYSNNKNAGTATATITGAGEYTGTASRTFTILRKTVTVSGIEVRTKTYDGTTAAIIDCDGVTISGTVGSDELTVSGITGTYEDKNAGTGKLVTLNYENAVLSGSGAPNYQLENSDNPPTTTANITKRVILVSGVQVSNKIYDGTTAATVSLSDVVLEGKAEGDDLTFSGITAAFDSETAGKNKTVTLNYDNAELSGADADNYQLVVSGSQETIKARILKKTLNVVAGDKTISFGDEPANSGVTYSGFIGEEDTSVLSGEPSYKYNTASSGSGDNYMVGSPVGSYFIIPGGLSATNYDFDYVNGILTVEERVVSYEGGTVTQDENGYDVTLDEGTGSAKPLPIGEDGELDMLDYSRTLTAPGSSEGDKTVDDRVANLYTVCLPFEPVTDAAVKYYTLSSVNGTILNFGEVETPAAATPYLVAVTGSVNITESCADIEVNSMAINNTTVGGYTLKGTYSGLSNAEAQGLYILQDGGKWGKVTSTNPQAYLPPFRAYIEGLSDSARELNSSFGGDSTGVTTLRTVDLDGTEHWYDLRGRRIAEPAKKGIFIYNGKKVIK